MRVGVPIHEQHFHLSFRVGWGLAASVFHTEAGFTVACTVLFVEDQSSSLQDKNHIPIVGINWPLAGSLGTEAEVWVKLQRYSVTCKFGRNSQSALFCGRTECSRVLEGKSCCSSPYSGPSITLPIGSGQISTSA